MAYAAIPMPYSPAQDPADRFYQFSITEPGMLETMMTLPTFTIKKFVIKSTRRFVHATMVDIDGKTMKFSVGKICNIGEKYNEDLPVLDLGEQSLSAFLENKVPNRFIMFGKLVTNNIPLPAVPVVQRKGWAVLPISSSPFRPRRKELSKRGKKVDKKSDKVRKNKRSKKLRV